MEGLTTDFNGQLMISKIPAPVYLFKPPSVVISEATQVPNQQIIRSWKQNIKTESDHHETKLEKVMQQFSHGNLKKLLVADKRYKADNGLDVGTNQAQISPSVGVNLCQGKLTTRGGAYSHAQSHSSFLKQRKVFSYDLESVAVTQIDTQVHSPCVRSRVASAQL